MIANDNGYQLAAIAILAQIFSSTIPMRTLLFTCLYIVVSHALAQPDLFKVDSDGHELAVWFKGSSTAEQSILLLHGRTYSSLPDFDLHTDSENLSMMDALVARGFNVYALDARGYGATKRDTSGWLTPNQAARDAIAAVRWIKVRESVRPHVFGWSYGSMVAQLIAQRHGNELASITLFGYPFDPSRHVLPQTHAYPALPPAKINTAAHAASDFIVEDAISQAGIEAYVAAALSADPVRVDFRDLHQWAELDASRVITPTLLIQAEHDPIAPTPIQRKLFENLGTKDKWWVVLPGGDHAALLETPRFKMFDAMTAFAGGITPD